MNVYVDTSVVLQVLFEQSAPHPMWGKWTRAYASELLGVEARRTIDRMRLTGALDDEGVADAQRALTRIERGIGRIALTRSVLRRASLPMATVTKTLDAIHLASALLFTERRGEALSFATHDTKLALAARALGFDAG